MTTNIVRRSGAGPALVAAYRAHRATGAAGEWVTPEQHQARQERRAANRRARQSRKINRRSR